MKPKKIEDISAQEYIKRKLDEKANVENANVRIWNIYHKKFGRPIKRILKIKNIKSQWR